MAITLPLDPNATAAADDAFYAKYPDMVNADGSRIPLDPNNPEHSDMIADWRDMYEEAADAPEEPPEDPPEETPEEPQPDEGEEDGGDEDEGGDGSDDVPGNDQPPDEHCQACEDEEEEEEEPKVKYRVSFFFDGTGNNRFNVGTQYSDAGESNVSKMEHCCFKGTKERYTYKSFYVEGIGTESGSSDDWVGSGAGTGDRGVRARVEQAIVTFIDYVQGLSEPLPVEEFLIDAVGFSRGAAAARYFIWRIHTELGSGIFENFAYGTETIHDRLDEALTMECKAEFKFLGLFDTVSSHGTDHENDVADLHLNEIYHASTIVQLAAAEEHRQNFQLTTISSGTEIYLPGVHSDVGGGYANNAREDDWQVLDIDAAWLGDEVDQKLTDDRNWFLERGWFTETEMPEPGFWDRRWRELKGSRGPITNYYSRIPLGIMLDKFKNTGAQFYSHVLNWDAHTLDGIPNASDKTFLKEVRSTLLPQLGGGNCSGPSHWLNNTSDDWHNTLRHDHLHISARYGEFAYAHVPNWVPNDVLTGSRRRGTNAG